MAAEKLTYQDPTAGILDWLTKATGGKTTTTTTGTNGIDPSFLKPLQDIFATQFGDTTPEGAAKLISEIFRVGSREVPVLANQFANATGARTGRNSLLAFANNDLQTKLTGQATTALRGLRQDASQTAGQIAANAPRTQTQTSTTKTPANKLALLPMALGQLGNIGKLGGKIKGISDDIFGNSDTGFGSVTGGSGGFGQTVNNPSAFVAPDLSPIWEPAGGISNAANFDFGDPLGGVDFSNMVSDWAPATDLPSIADSFDFSALPDFDLGAFFADGGRIRIGRANARAHGYADGGPIEFQMGAKRKSRLDEIEDAAVKGEAPPTQTPVKKAEEPPKKEKSTAAKIGDFLRGRADGGLIRRYADGGQIRGVTDMGQSGGSEAPTTGFAPSRALDVAGVASGIVDSVGNNGVTVPSTGGMDFTSEKLGEDVVSYFAGLDAAASNSGYNDPSRQFYTGKDGYSYMNTDQGIRQANNKTRFDDADDGKWRAGKFDKVFNYDGTFNDINVIRPEASNTSFGSWLMTAASLASGNPAGFAASMGTKAALPGIVGMASGQGLKPHMFGGVNKGGAGRPQSTIPTDFTGSGFKNGGPIKGRGTGTSDSIPIMASDGEFMLSADTVDAVGVEFLQMLQDMFHTPVHAGAR